MDEVRKVAVLDTPVVLLGETGAVGFGQHKTSCSIKTYPHRSVFYVGKITI
jgi:hypothetical protein